MSNLKKRLSSLEGDARGGSTVVMIHSWLGDGEYFALTHGDAVIRREQGEAEDRFLVRAERELIEQFANLSVLTCFAIRQSELGCC